MGDRDRCRLECCPYRSSFFSPFLLTFIHRHRTRMFHQGTHRVVDMCHEVKKKLKVCIWGIQKNSRTHVRRNSHSHNKDERKRNDGSGERRGKGRGGRIGLKVKRKSKSGEREINKPHQTQIWHMIRVCSFVVADVVVVVVALLNYIVNIGLWMRSSLF